MLQTIRQTPRWFATAALKPQLALAGVRYRLQGWMSGDKALSETILQGITPDDDEFRHLSFTFAVIALSARVACVDGALTRDKYIAYRESFPLKGGVCGKIRSLFTLACKNETPYEHYVTQIKYIFPDRPELFASLIDRMFRIAAADGGISRSSERLLSGIAHMLGIPASDYADILAKYDQPSTAREILGIDKGRIKAKTLKKRYRELMQRYHPDRFAGQDISPEVQQLLQLKSSQINAAYRTLAKRAA